MIKRTQLDEEAKKIDEHWVHAFIVVSVAAEIIKKLEPSLEKINKDMTKAEVER